MNWRDHCSLFRRKGPATTCIARGELHAMVGIAMTIAQRLDDLFIETDAGQMFCHREIAYLLMLGDRSV